MRASFSDCLKRKKLRKESEMRRAQLIRWFSTRRLLIGLGTGMLILLLLVFVPLTSWGSSILNSPTASANDLHPFTISSPDFHPYGPLPRRSEFKGFGCQ